MFLIAFKSASGGITVVSPANPLPVTVISGGGGGGGDVNIASIGGNPVTTAIPITGTVEVTGEALDEITDSISGAQRVVGSDTANNVLVLNPDGTPVDFNETVEFLPQTEVNPDSVTSLPFSISGADTDVVIAAVVDKRHVIVSAMIEFSGAAAITLTQKGSTVTYNVVAGEKWVLDPSPYGHWETNVNEAFSIGKSAAITVRGRLQYRSLD